MAPSLITYNPVGAQCSLTASDTCLYQVAGYIDNDPQAQLSACQALFGFPAVPTVTLSADPVLSTDIASSIYTDIITSTETKHQTETSTLTYTVTISETDTQYTTTQVNTVLTTDFVTVTTRVATSTFIPAPPPTPAKRLRRRGCGSKPSSSTVVTSPESSASLPSSSTPVSSSPVSSPTSALESISASSTAASSLVPHASACPDLAAYSSACACIELPAVTQSAEPTTSTILQTEHITVTSTAYTTTITTATQTVQAEDDATTTATTTQYTNTQTTTTSTTTTTTTIAPPIPTKFAWRTNEDPARNMYLSGAGIYKAYLSTLSTLVTPMGLLTPNTQPTNFWSPAWKMYVRFSTSWYGSIMLMTDSDVAVSPYTLSPVTCFVDDDLVLNCKTTRSFILTRFIVCGDELLMIAAGHTPPSGCSVVQVNAVA